MTDPCKHCGWPLSRHLKPCPEPAPELPLYDATDALRSPMLSHADHVWRTLTGLPCG